MGSQVQAGDPLFRIDDRQILAELHVREGISVIASHAGADRRVASPEEIPPSEARVRKAEADVVAQRKIARAAREAVRASVVPEEEVIEPRQSLASSVEGLLQAKAEDQLLKAGSWKHDKTMARAEVQPTTRWSSSTGRSWTACTSAPRHRPWC